MHRVWMCVQGQAQATYPMCVECVELLLKEIKKLIEETEAEEAAYRKALTEVQAMPPLSPPSSSSSSSAGLLADVSLLVLALFLSSPA